MFKIAHCCGHVKITQRTGWKRLDSILSDFREQLMPAATHQTSELKF